MHIGTLLWIFGDLFLAAIPVGLAFWIARGLRRDAQNNGHIRWFLWLPSLFVWLAFLPNTCYLLTEWRHFLSDIYGNANFYRVCGQGQYATMPVVNLLLLATFYLFYTSFGLLALFLSIWPLKQLAQKRWKRLAQLGQPIVFILCALGVYLGLVGRFNSWDALRPRMLFAILHTLSDIAAHPLVAAMIFTFGAALWLLYTLFDIFMDGAASRFHWKPLEKVNHASQ